jgi:cytochrome b6
VPVIGEFVRRFLRGGEEVTGATLTRFFGFHVAVLPGLTTLFLLIHVALVQKWGMSSPNRNPGQPEPSMPFLPNFVMRELMAWYGALAVLGSLAALFPWELGSKADPFAPAPAGIRPEWYFLAVFYSLKLIPSKVLFFDGEVLGILFFGLAAAGWMLIPFWDRRSEEEERHRLLTGAGVFVVAYLVVFSALGYWR